MSDTDTRDPSTVVQAQRDIQKEVAQDDRQRDKSESLTQKSL